MDNFDANICYDFLTSIVTDIPEGHRLLLWSTADKRSRWAETVDEAVEQAQSINGNTYFGVCLVPQDPTICTPTTRAKASQVSMALCLWADIDVRCAHHAKENLPPTIQDALNCIEQAYPPTLQPTLITSTGGGLQAFWTFAEPLDITEDQDKVFFASTAKAWQGLLANVLAKKGWTLDSTADLARVMRLGGSLNHNAQGKPIVSILQRSSAMYALEDFTAITQSIVSEEDLQSVSTKCCIKSNDALVASMPSVASVFPRRGATQLPPLRDKIATWCACSDSFNLSWQNQNPQLSDTSRSSYDASLVMSMAHAMVMGSVNFTPQDMADVIVDHRLMYGQTAKDFKKASRLDYIQITIAKCIQKAQQSQALSNKVETIETCTQPEQLLEKVPSGECPFQDTEKAEQSDNLFIPELPQKPTAKKDEDVDNALPEIEGEANKAVIKEIEERWAIRILRGAVYENDIDLALYLVPFHGGRPWLLTCTNADLFNMRNAERAIANACRVVPLCMCGEKPCKKHDWQRDITRLLNALPKKLKADEATDEGLLNVFMREYLANNGNICTDIDERDYIDATRAPFLWRGTAYVSVSSFVAFNPQIPAAFGGMRGVAQVMINAGYIQRRLQLTRADGSYVRVRVYAVPNNVRQDAMNEPVRTELNTEPTTTLNQKQKALEEFNKKIAEGTITQTFQTE